MSAPAVNLAQALHKLQAMADQAAARSTGGDATRPADGETFAGALKHAVDQLDAVKKHAGATAQAFERGESGVSLAQVMIDQQKAGLATKFDMRVRDEVVKAYRDIMNMQV